jgi:hypothetical protein
LSRHSLTKAFHAALVALPFVLMVLPVDFFDKGTSVCLSKTLAGMECYACGLTRGVMHLLHLDFQGAWAFNRLTFIVAPLLSLFWIKSVMILAGKPLPGWLDQLT